MRERKKKQKRNKNMFFLFWEFFHFRGPTGEPAQTGLTLRLVMCFGLLRAPKTPMRGGHLSTSGETSTGDFRGVELDFTSKLRDLKAKYPDQSEPRSAYGRDTWQRRHIRRGLAPMTLDGGKVSGLLPPSPGARR